MKPESLVKRTLTGLLLVGATVSAAYCGGKYVAVLFWLVMNLGLPEWGRLLRRSALRISLFWLFLLSNSLYIALVTGFYAQAGLVDPAWREFATWGLVLEMVVFFAVSTFGRGRAAAKQVSAVLGGALYIGGSLGLLNYLALPFHPDGGHVLMGFFLIIWSGDVFAYLTGSAFGRHKLCPSLSPSKTWEGAAGGFVFAALAGILWGHAFWDSVSFEIRTSVSLLAPVVAMFGDLFESKIKRDAGVKDSGSVLPGHGGILDRYDSVFFAAPFVVALWKLFS